MEVFKKIPESLELQSTFKDHIKKNSSVLLVGQKVNEKYSFYTGLVKIKNNWFYGDHLNKGKKSLCIVKFENDWSSFQIHYFNNWYIDNPKERMNFCFDYVSEIGE